MGYVLGTLAKQGMKVGQQTHPLEVRCPCKASTTMYILRALGFLTLPPRAYLLVHRRASDFRSCTEVAAEASEEQGRAGQGIAAFADHGGSSTLQQNKTRVADRTTRRCVVCGMRQQGWCIIMYCRKVRPSLMALNACRQASCYPGACAVIMQTTSGLIALS